MAPCQGRPFPGKMVVLSIGSGSVDDLRVFSSRSGNDCRSRSDSEGRRPEKRSVYVSNLLLPCRAATYLRRAASRRRRATFERSREYTMFRADVNPLFLKQTVE